MTSQTTFTEALLDPKQAVPDGIVDPQGRPAPKRFAVYRNNVAVSLTEALETAFPVIAKLLGAQNFRTLAGVFLRQHPPSSPLMMFYGAEMPGFLENFPPVQSLGYLPDIARLELALRHAYHSEDAQVLDPEVLERIAPDALMDLRVKLAPATQVVRSPWPIHAIWIYNMTTDAPKPQMSAQDVLITRPAFDPVQTLLPLGGAKFIEALRNGTLGAAIETAAAIEGFDLTTTLGALLSSGALSQLHEAPE